MSLSVRAAPRRHSPYAIPPRITSFTAGGRGRKGRLIFHSTITISLAHNHTHTSRVIAKEAPGERESANQPTRITTNHRARWRLSPFMLTFGDVYCIAGGWLAAKRTFMWAGESMSFSFSLSISFPGGCCCARLARTLELWSAMLSEGEASTNSQLRKKASVSLD